MTKKWLRMQFVEKIIFGFATGIILGAITFLLDSAAERQRNLLRADNIRIELATSQLADFRRTVSEIDSLLHEASVKMWDGKGQAFADTINRQRSYARVFIETTALGLLKNVHASCIKLLDEHLKHANLVALNIDHEVIQKDLLECTADTERQVIAGVRTAQAGKEPSLFKKIPLWVWLAIVCILVAAVFVYIRSPETE